MKKIQILFIILMSSTLLLSENPGVEPEYYYPEQDEEFVCPLLADIETESSIDREREIIINWLIFASIIFAVLHIITLRLVLKHIKSTKKDDESC